MSNPFDSDHTIPKVSVETVDRLRDNFVDAAGGDAAFREQLAAADLLLVPLPGHGDYLMPVFPQGTMEVLQFLQEKLPEGMHADIAVEDEAYEELTLHAAEIILPTLLTNPLLVGLAINLVSSYLYDLLKDTKAQRETRVRARVLVEDDQRTVAIDYDGPVEQFSELTRQAFAREVPEVERVAHRNIKGMDEPTRLPNVSAPKVLRAPAAAAPDVTTQRDPLPAPSSRVRHASDDDGSKGGE